MNNQTAVSANYQRHLKEIAQYRMSRCSPNEEARIIAEHYTSLALLALELRRITEAIRYSGSSTAMGEIRERLVTDIKRMHEHDFGISLEWPKQP